MELLKAEVLIASCGMNCNVCFAYLRETNKVLDAEVQMIKSRLPELNAK